MIKHTPDLYHLEYVQVNLGRNVPLPNDPNNGLVMPIARMRTIALERKMQMLIVTPNLQTQQNVVRIWTQVQNILAKPADLSRQEEEAKLRMSLARADADVVTQKLDSFDPMHRLVAVQTIGQRHLHREADVIDRLSDQEPLIRQAARQALVRLARGADFGPPASASKLERSQAIRKWRAWLALQDKAKATSVAPPSALEADALRLSAQFVQSDAKEQDRLLSDWKDREGEAVTLALSAVLPELKPHRQSTVRQTLADRFASFANEKIAAYLADDDPEIRRAAARAVGVKKVEALIPELLQALEDNDAPVVQAARTSLRKCTSKDFGPEPNAAPLERFAAIGQWYRWWNERTDKAASKN